MGAETEAETKPVEPEPEVEQVDDRVWTKTNIKFQLRVTDFPISGLVSGRKYDFRVSCVDQAGQGKWSTLATPAEPKEMYEKPDIDLDESCRKVVVEKAGHTIRLKATFSGRPTPRVKWTKQSDTLAKRADVTIVGNTTEVVIPECNRLDTGKYTLNVQNNAGFKTVNINVKVKDTPGYCENFEIRDVQKHSVSLNWEEPFVDGCSPITHYIIQKREANQKTWSYVNQNYEKTSIKVSELRTGNDYYFRVIACNEFGEGQITELLQPARPSAPMTEPGPIHKLKVSDVNAHGCVLSWCAPDHTGHAKLTGYRVEIKEVNEEEDKEKKASWEDYRTVTECKCECIGLVTGNKYKFRIKSKNAKFVSSGRETETITIKEPAEEPFITVKRMFKVTAGSSLVIEGIITG